MTMTNNSSRYDSRSLVVKTVENNRNWLLLAAHVSFLCLSSLSNVPELLCQTFSLLIHFLYLSFFSWTALYGYMFYQDLVNVLQTRVINLKIFYTVGYLLPLTTCLVMFLVSFLSDYDLYLRRKRVYHLWDEDYTPRGAVEACYLSVEPVPALVIPAGLVAIINLYLALRVVRSVRRSGRTRYVRNMIILSLLLGGTWTIGLLPYSDQQPYSEIVQAIGVLLNGLTGVYILGKGRKNKKSVKFFYGGWGVQGNFHTFYFMPKMAYL